MSTQPLSSVAFSKPPVPMDAKYRRVTSNASSALSSGLDFAARQVEKAQKETVCYHPNAKIVSVVAFNDISSPVGSEGKPKSNGGLAWNSQLEQTIAVGPLQIYRAPASIAFLSCGAALQALFPKSQCWCLDSLGSKYILQIRPPHYWRIELPVTQVAERQMAAAFQKSIKDILLFEKTKCPLRQDGQGTAAADQLTKADDAVLATSIRSCPSTPDLAIKPSYNNAVPQETIFCPDDRVNTAQSDSFIENDNVRSVGRNINPALREEIRLMKSLPALSSLASTGGTNQANISRKRQSLSAEKCMEPSSLSKSETSHHNPKQPDRSPIPLVSRAIQTLLAAQPLAEVSHHTATALFRHADTAALDKGNAPDSEPPVSETPIGGESRNTALDRQMRETRRRLPRPQTRRAQSVPDCPYFPMMPVDKTETGCSTGCLQLLESIYNSLIQLPGQLISLMVRLARTIADVLWAAEPDAYAVFSQGNYVPEWDDSGGELSGFSDDEYVVGEHIRRLRNQQNS